MPLKKISSIFSSEESALAYEEIFRLDSIRAISKL